MADEVAKRKRPLVGEVIDESLLPRDLDAATAELLRTLDRHLGIGFPEAFGINTEPEKTVDSTARTVEEDEGG